MRIAPAEMIAFGHVLKRHNAGYFTHLRDESNKVIETIEEAIEIAQECGVHARPRVIMNLSHPPTAVLEARPTHKRRRGATLRRRTGLLRNSGPF